MEKTMRKTLIALVVLLAAGVAAYFMLSNPVGRLVKLAVNEFGPKLTQAEVHVSNVEIATRDGKGKLSGLLLGNPKGFKTDYALKAGTIDIDLDTASLAKKVVVIHKILIDAPSIIYEKGEHGSNFDAIQHNVEQYLGAGNGKNKQAEGGESKKLIIDTFTIRNAKVNYNGTVNLSLPDIELHGIGRKGGGATSAQVVKAVIAELNAKLVVALAKTAAIGAVGGPAIGAGMAIKSLMGK
jgi:hypothetical protein